MQELTNIAVLVLGLWLIMEGQFTAGLLLAFQSFMTAFMDPVNQLINAGQSLQEMRSSLERIDDVAEYPEDEVFGPNPTDEELANARKLSGNVEMRNITFGYSKSRPL